MESDHRGGEGLQYNTVLKTLGLDTFFTTFVNGQVTNIKQVYYH